MDRTRFNVDRLVYIEQPPFLPWLGFCEALVNCDVVVLYDNVQFVAGGWQNRNRIKTASGVQWITLPVQKRHGQLIRDVLVAPHFDARKIVKQLSLAYGRCSFFVEAMEVIEEPLFKGRRWLSDLNYELVERITTALDGSAILKRASELSIEEEPRKTTRISMIVAATGSNVLWAGDGTQKYLDLDEFAQTGLTVRWNRFSNRHPEHTQVWTKQGFVPGLSVIDAASNIGWSGVKVLLLRSLQSVNENSAKEKSYEST